MKPCGGGTEQAKLPTTTLLVAVKSFLRWCHHLPHPEPLDVQPPHIIIDQSRYDRTHDDHLARSRSWLPHYILWSITTTYPLVGRTTPPRDHLFIYLSTGCCLSLELLSFWVPGGTVELSTQCKALARRVVWLLDKLATHNSKQLTISARGDFSYYCSSSTILRSMYIASVLERVSGSHHGCLVEIHPAFSVWRNNLHDEEDDGGSPKNK